jgi:hypothetical protein
MEKCHTDLDAGNFHYEHGGNLLYEMFADIIRENGYSL